MVDLFQKAKACGDEASDACHPIFQKSSRQVRFGRDISRMHSQRIQTVSGQPIYFVMCWKWTASKTHFYKLLPRRLETEVDHLTSLFEVGYSIDSSIESCTVIKQQNSRSVKCGKYIFSKHFESLLNVLGINHSQGQGIMVKRDCPVRFYVFEPQDIDSSPFLLWISIGIHKHVPPPPAKMPTKYCQDILSILRRIDDPTLTTGGYIRNIC